MTAATAGPFDVAGSTLVPARVRNPSERSVVHVVPVLHSDGEPKRPALCGFRPAQPWVLYPAVARAGANCPVCAERQDAAAAAETQEAS